MGEDTSGPSGPSDRGDHDECRASSPRSATLTSKQGPAAFAKCPATSLPPGASFSSFSSYSSSTLPNATRTLYYNAKYGTVESLSDTSQIRGIRDSAGRVLTVYTDNAIKLEDDEVQLEADMDKQFKETWSACASLKMQSTTDDFFDSTTVLQCSEPHGRSGWTEVEVQSTIDDINRATSVHMAVQLPLQFSSSAISVAGGPWFVDKLRENLLNDRYGRWPIRDIEELHLVRYFLPNQLMSLPLNKAFGKDARLDPVES